MKTLRTLFAIAALALVGSALALVQPQGYAGKSLLRAAHSVSFRGSSEGSSAFSPTDIAGLQFWYDASQLALANNDPVASFTDLSGNGRHLLQATASYKPTFLTNRQNGLPGVVGDGVDDYMQTAPFTLNQPTHYFIVAKINQTNNIGSLFDGNTGATARLARNSGTLPSGQLFLYSGAFGGPVTSGVDTSLPHLYAVLSDGANSKISVDGGSAFTGNAGTANAGGVNIFAVPSSGQMAAEIYEFIGYNAEITGANLTALQSYLAAKWGY